ncbi:MAG: hypothetical protein DRN71_03785 [Candidatus Nanohalarchaeota archaeon]|nr:MAG: hypothetical protein DRN71_03785 [Candidatus Nanohaloarchaeota archaeon]
MTRHLHGVWSQLKERYNIAEFIIIVKVVTIWTNLAKNQETLIYPGESSIHWILKLHGNFKDMVKTFVHFWLCQKAWHVNAMK